MSAVDIQIGDKWIYSLGDWSIQSGSSPTVPGDMTGGATEISFGLPEGVDSRTLGGKAVLLRDAEMGSTSGELALSGGNGVNTTLRGYSKLAKLNVTRKTEPFEGTLRAALLYYLSLCGVTTDIEIATTLASRAVRYIGWEGNVLDHLKDLCCAQGMEIALIGKTLIFRPTFGRTISTHSFADYTWQQDATQLAQAVDVNWFDTRPQADQLIYPVGGWNPDVPTFSVDAGQVVVQEIDLAPADDTEGAPAVGVSAISILQPTCVAAVNRYYTGPNSVYSVSGTDGIAIQPGQWAAGGGSLKVELLEGGNRLRVTITGSTETQYAPYSIAMSAGPSDTYSSLRIFGRGARYTRHTIHALTGLDGDRAPQETAPAVTTPFLSSKDSAWKAVEGLLAKHGGPGLTIEGTLGKVRPLSTTKSAWFGGGAIEEDPSIQTYGNLEGACFWAEDTFFRIRNVTYTPQGATFTAERAATSGAIFKATSTLYTTAAQFAAAYPAGMTAGQYGATQTKGYTL